MKQYMVPKNNVVSSFRMFRNSREHLIGGTSRTTVIDWYFSEEDLITFTIQGKRYYRIFFKNSVQSNSLDYEDGFEVFKEQIVEL